MQQNKLIKLCVETRAKELREDGNSFDDIASVLSSEVNQKVTKSDVFRYFKQNEQAAIRVIEKQDKLKAVVVEAEISTIEDRKTVIRGLLGIATSAENEHTRVLAFKEANNALDSLDKRLGKLTGDKGVTINNINAMKLSDIPTETLQRWRDEAKEF